MRNPNFQFDIFNIPFVELPIYKDKSLEKPLTPSAKLLTPQYK